MARRRISPTVVSVLALLLGAAAPAWSQQPTGGREREVQQALDLARASNAAVEAEVARLNQAVSRQQDVLAGARQAERSAAAQVDAATRKLADTEARARAAKAELARRAVGAYVHPAAEAGLALFSQAGSIGELAQRRTLVAVVQGRTVDVIGKLRAAREDQAIAAEELEHAREAAAARAESEAAEAARLDSERRVQQAAHDALASRITGLEAESRALAAQAAELEARIRARSAAAAVVDASPASPPGPAPVAGGNSSYGFAWPVRGVLTSEFGPRWGSFHSGIDIGAPEGTPIVATKAGVVISAGWLGGYGNLVVIDHGSGVSTAYAHQSRIGTTDGARVGQGQVIGYVGSTGVSTGNHLHFEVRVGGSAQDPMRFLP